MEGTSNQSVSFNLNSLEDTQALAKRLAESLSQRDALLLKGPLGSGKTTLARFLIQNLMGKEVQVTSPTFTLMQPYKTPKGPLWHIDLYRLKDLEPLDLDLPELWHHSITVIEWPERLGALLPPQYVMVEIDIDRRSDTRRASLTGTPGWTQRLSGGGEGDP